MTVCEESRPFVVDRNIRHFVWYGGVAGEGLKSDREEALPLSKSGCSILPLVRWLQAGVLRGSGLYVWRPRPLATNIREETKPGKLECKEADAMSVARV